MKKVAAFFMAVWKWLDGKKRNIALIYWSVVVPAVAIVWPMGAPSNVTKSVAIIGVVLSAVGLGHAAIKTYVGNGDKQDPAPAEVTPTDPATK